MHCGTAQCHTVAVRHCAVCTHESFGTTRQPRLWDTPLTNFNLKSLDLSLTSQPQALPQTASDSEVRRANTGTVMVLTPRPLQPEAASVPKPGPLFAASRSSHVCGLE